MTRTFELWIPNSRITEYMAFVSQEGIGITSELYVSAVNYSCDPTYQRALRGLKRHWSIHGLMNVSGSTSEYGMPLLAHVPDAQAPIFKLFWSDNIFEGLTVEELDAQLEQERREMIASMRDQMTVKGQWDQLCTMLSLVSRIGRNLIQTAFEQYIKDPIRKALGITLPEMN